MALLPMISPFIWGDGGQKLTPDQVDRLRHSIDAAAARGSSTAPVGHWSQGLARLVDAWGAYRGNRRADQAEAEGMQGADAVVQALLSNGNATSFAPQQSPGGAGALSGAVESSGQFPQSLVGTESGGDWTALNNEGYGRPPAIRRGTACRCGTRWRYPGWHDGGAILANVA